MMSKSGVYLKGWERGKERLCASNALITRPDPDDANPTQEYVKESGSNAKGLILCGYSNRDAFWGSVACSEVAPDATPLLLLISFVPFRRVCSVADWLREGPRNEARKPGHHVSGTSHA